MFQLQKTIVSEEILEKASLVIQKAMEKVLIRSYLKYETKIPLKVNYGFGKNLGEVK